MLNSLIHPGAPTALTLKSILGLTINNATVLMRHLFSVLCLLFIMDCIISYCNRQMIDRQTDVEITQNIIHSYVVYFLVSLRNRRHAFKKTIYVNIFLNKKRVMKRWFRCSIVLCPIVQPKHLAFSYKYILIHYLYCSLSIQSPKLCSFLLSPSLAMCKFSC